MMSSGNVSQKEKDKRLKQPGYLHLLARDMFSSPPEQVIVTIVVGHHNHRHHCHCHYYHCHFTIIISTIVMVTIVINIFLVM